VEVSPSGVKGSVRRDQEYQAERPIEPALAEWAVLLGIADTKLAATLSETLRAEGIHTKCFSSMEEARTLIAKDRPSIAILEHHPPYIDGLEMCRAIREQENDHQHQLPFVMVAAQENQAAGAAAGVTDWLIRPFTDAYARTKICAWVLRTACQRSRVVIFEDEKRRLAGPLVRVRRAPMVQRGRENKRFSKNVISTDKSALLWMYCREIAPFETPAFSKAVGDLITRAARRPPEMRERSAAIS
jgi:DNA-binding response OmpR family regulator